MSQANKRMFYMTYMKTNGNQMINKKTALTHFSPVSHFYTPWKRQQTKETTYFSKILATYFSKILQKYL